jgi:hypothetical protein
VTPRITDSSSINAVSFSSARATKRFPSSRCPSATKIVRPRESTVDLIFDALPFGRLWYIGPNAVSNAIGYAKSFSSSHNTVIRVYDDDAGNVIEAQEQAGKFKEVAGTVATPDHP